MFTTRVDTEGLTSVLGLTDFSRGRSSRDKAVSTDVSRQFSQKLSMLETLRMNTNRGSGSINGTLPSANKSIGVSFEAGVLSTLLQSLFDLSAKSAFGSGVAGSSFSMLLSQQVASKIASTNSIGIAQMIDRRVADGREGFSTTTSFEMTRNV